MTSGKLRVGIIGIGWYSTLAHVPLLRATGRAEVVAVSRRNRERLALAKEELAIPDAYTDWREMLDRAALDAVVISTPHNLHVEPAREALKRGLHVLVEKPLALTYAEALSVAQAAEQAQRVLMVGLDVRGMGSWRAAKSVLDSGSLGRIRQVTVTCAMDYSRVFWDDIRLSGRVQERIQSSPLTSAVWSDVLRREDNWRAGSPTLGGGGFVDVGTHVVDLMLWLAGSAPTHVAAFTHSGDSGLASIVNAQARLSNGAHFSLVFNDSVAAGDFDFQGHGRLTVYGDQGSLTAEWTGFMATEAQGVWVERRGLTEQVKPEPNGVSVDQSFVSTVLDHAPNIATAHAAAHAVALIEATYRSAKRGKIVWVEDLLET